jgi:hypothetical protein
MSREIRAAALTRLGAPLLLALALALACGGAVARKLSPLEGYTKAGGDAPPFDEISKTCQDQAAFRDASGISWTDWQQFEACMNQHGWTRAPAKPAGTPP